MAKHKFTITDGVAACLRGTIEDEALDDELWCPSPHNCPEYCVVNGLVTVAEEQK